MVEYIIPEEDFNKYLKACFKTASIFMWDRHQAIINPYRGAKPPVDLVKFILDQKGIEYKEYPIITSGFIDNRKNFITYGLIDAFEEELERKGYLSFIFPDAFISGSAIKGFKRLFSQELIRDIIKELKLENMLIEMTYVALKQDYPKEFEHANTHQKKYENNVSLNFKTYSLGLNEIITEDKPDYLGIDYLYENPKESGVKYPIISPVKTKGKVTIENSELKSNKQYISEQFIDLAKQQILKDYFK